MQSNRVILAFTRSGKNSKCGYTFQSLISIYRHPIPPFLHHGTPPNGHFYTDQRPLLPFPFSLSHSFACFSLVYTHDGHSCFISALVCLSMTPGVAMSKFIMPFVHPSHLMKMSERSSWQ